MPTTDNVLRLVDAGLDIESFDVADRTTDNIIRIGKAIIARGGRPKLLNAGSKTTDNLLRIHDELGGRVTFSGI